MVPKRRHITYWRRGNTQKNIHNILRHLNIWYLKLKMKCIYRVSINNFPYYKHLLQEIQGKTLCLFCTLNLWDVTYCTSCIKFYVALKIWVKLYSFFFRTIEYPCYNVPCWWHFDGETCSSWCASYVFCKEMYLLNTILLVSMFMAWII